MYSQTFSPHLCVHFACIRHGFKEGHAWQTNEFRSGERGGKYGATPGPIHQLGNCWLRQCVTSWLKLRKYCLSHIAERCRSNQLATRNVIQIFKGKVFGTCFRQLSVKYHDPKHRTVSVLLTTSRVKWVSTANKTLRIIWGLTLIQWQISHRLPM